MMPDFRQKSVGILCVFQGLRTTKTALVGHYDECRDDFRGYLKTAPVFQIEGQEFFDNQYSPISSNITTFSNPLFFIALTYRQEYSSKAIRSINRFFSPVFCFNVENSEIIEL